MDYNIGIGNWSRSENFRNSIPKSSKSKTASILISLLSLFIVILAGFKFVFLLYLS